MSICLFNVFSIETYYSRDKVTSIVFFSKRLNCFVVFIIYDHPQAMFVLLSALLAKLNYCYKN